MSDIDEIKSRINIVDLIGARVELKKAGRNFKALCPFHNEKTPSFIVSPDRQTFHCFGCGKGGSVFDWMMEYEHVDFSEALETLAEKAGVKLERWGDDTGQNRIKAKIYEVNKIASDFYHYILIKHPLGEKARQYLKSRGVSDKTAETFGLGYSPNSWDNLRKFLHKKGYDNELLETAGLIIKSNSGGYDRFRGRVMFTLRDHKGNVVGFSGRVLDPMVKEAKYINTSETPVYIKGNTLYGFDLAKSAIQKTGAAILVEGEFDLISLFQEGITNVVAIKGSALTEGHIRLLKRYTENLIFALDADLAGDSAARRGITLAEKAGFDMKVLRISDGKDPDEAIRENPVAFKKSIKDALPIYDYFIESAAARYDRNSPFGKKKMSNEIMPVLAHIENPVVQAHYVKKVAELLDVGEQVVTEGMKKSIALDVRGNILDKPLVSLKDPFNPQERLEIYLLALILQTKTSEYFEELKENFDSADFCQTNVRLILEALDKYISNHPKFLIKDFSVSLPSELIPFMDQAYLWDLSDIIDNDELIAREWNKILREFKRQVIKKKLKDYATQAEILEQNGQTEEASQLRSEIPKLTGELRGLEKSTSI
jgi:DNA primase